MKKYLFLFLTFIIFNTVFAKKTINFDNCSEEFNSIINDTTKNIQNVVVCLGKYAYAYHRVSNCSGLNNCKAEVKLVTEQNALEAGRKPCCKCWSNVSSNCVNDEISNENNSQNQSYDDSNANEAYVYTALLMVGVGLFVVSNEFYVAPTLSFKNNIESNGIKREVLFPSYGLNIQLRKNFKNSGLEYGAGFVRYKYNPYSNFYNFFGGNEEKDVWRINLNYVHNIFYNKLPEKLEVFLGPSLNFETNNKKFGFGGILGTSYSLLSWLKADLRYELTTTTNQVSLGFRVLYQKDK